MEMILNRFPQNRCAQILYSDRIIVEVVSDTSGSRDYHPKKDAYQLIPTLMDYIIIESESIFVSHYKRAPGGWTKHVYNEQRDVIQLTDNVAVPLSDIYRGVIF